MESLMQYKVYVIPNYHGDAIDLLFCNASDPASQGLMHYAYAVAADQDVMLRRGFPWRHIRDFTGKYRQAQIETILRLQKQTSYTPGELTLEWAGESTFVSDHDTIMRLGALELLANLSSGRLATTDKDPFPHQLALQQFMKKPPRHQGLRRLLIADEVGLGKTIEVGLILRDMLLALGRLEGFTCLYLTSGGLIEDAADKLRDVLSGVIDNQHIVDTVESFRTYGQGSILGVRVASMHAARLYANAQQKSHLPTRVRPDIVIIDECHHAASDGDLAGRRPTSENSTQTYLAAKQLLDGTFWTDSVAPSLAILMSATPFRSASQFTNLLRLLTHGTLAPDGTVFDAFQAQVRSNDLRTIAHTPNSGATVVWRRQSDEGVKSWTNKRIFPNLTIIRPHKVDAKDPYTPFLCSPSVDFLDLINRIKSRVKAIANAHGQSFGGFALAHLERKLTSSSIAGACWLFSWAVRHCFWDTQEQFKNDKGQGAEALRRLIRRISQRLAEFNQQSTAGHASVRFPSDRFEFPAQVLAQAGAIVDIHRYSKAMRAEIFDSQDWLATDTEIRDLVGLGEALLELANRPGDESAAEDAKLSWLSALLDWHPSDRILLFTESLQTCEVLQSRLGSKCRTLVGSMSLAARSQVVSELRNSQSGVGVLIATSAADEGFDLQVASKVVHWDLSSSPATLMQRNGRVARLGQICDVTSYYLILAGTLEERRDSALQSKFAEMGIDDESLRSRILGSLSEEEEERLREAIETCEEGVVGDILRGAAEDNERMDRELRQIRTDLEYAQVLNREDLANRLYNWQKLGLPEAAVDGITVSLDKIAWSRPLFGESGGTQSTFSIVAGVKDASNHQSLIFDPEYLVFGSNVGDHGAALRLAGIPPWAKSTTKHGRICVRPYTNEDLLGRYLYGVARLPHADFVSIPNCLLIDATRHGTDDGESLVPRPPWIDRVRWLLFCTHPIREMENVLEPKLRPYLTYYVFEEVDRSEKVSVLNEEGADAAEVQALLQCMEAHAVSGLCKGIRDELSIDRALRVGKHLTKWIESVTRFGASDFLTEEKYFVPIPVALVEVRG